jgi:GPH family glycoside/pentoside/hexuronide:cation symporter
VTSSNAVASQDAGHSADRLPLLRLIGFSQPGLSIGALAIAITVYLPRYYAGHFGLGLAAVGAVVMFVRLFDMAVDPLLGVLMDRTRTGIGRYRPWLLLSAPVMALGVYMLFIPPGGVSLGYMFAWLFVYYIGSSLITLSHASWGSVIASKYHERSRVFGVIQVVSLIGATLVLIIPIILAKQAKTGGDIRAMGAFICIVTVLGVLAAAFATREKIVKDQVHERFGLRDYWEMISRPDMGRIILADFCLALGPGWMAAIYLFYFHSARGFSTRDASLLLLLYVVAGVPGAGILSKLAMRFSKHRVLMCAAAGYSIGLVIMTTLPKGSMLLAAPFMFLMGFLASSFSLLDRAMVADVGDAVLLQQGKHRVGLLYAMITSAQKIAAALSIGLSFTVLGWIGFNPVEGAANTPSAIFGLELVYLIGPVSFVMLGAAIYIGYKLDGKRHAEIRAALDAREAQQMANEDVAPVLEAPVIESLAG